MGIISMRLLTSGVFQRLMAEAFPEIDGREARLREPRFVDLNNEISDDVTSRIDLAALHDRYVR